MVRAAPVAEWTATEANQSDVLGNTTSDKPAETTNQARSTNIGFQNWQSGRRSDSGSFDDWPQRIATAWQQTVHGIIETGKLLIEAKVCLGHGRFSDMIRDQLPFLPRAAQKLMSIAENPALANASHETHLPASWTTLYELSRHPARLVAEKIADGTITPRLERADVRRKVLGIEEPKRKPTDRGIQALRRERDALKAHIADLEAARDLPPASSNDGNSVADRLIREAAALAIEPLTEDQKLDALVAVCRAAGFAPSRVVDHESTRRKAAAVILEAPGKSAKRI